MFYIPRITGKVTQVFPVKTFTNICRYCSRDPKNGTKPSVQCYLHFCGLSIFFKYDREVQQRRCISFIDRNSESKCQEIEIYTCSSGRVL